ncbi:MAG: ribosomal protein L13e [Promethearchaeota archaeon]
METETNEKIYPTIKSPSREHHIRKGKGFSLTEIKEAGKTIQLLHKLNIPVDYFRKSTYKDNVEKLKKLKIEKKKGEKKKPYVYKEKERTPFKPKKEKVIKKPIKKELVVKKPTPKKKPKPIKKEKIKIEPTKVKKEKIELKGIPLTSLSGLGPATETKFHELGVVTVEDLTKEDPKELAALIKGASEERILKWIEEGKELIKQ